MYQQDPLFDELLRKPMMMADQNNETDDDYEDDEEEDLFGDDVMQALQAEKEAEQADADAFAASLLESQAEEEPEPAEAAAPEAPPPPPKEYTLPGIWRHPLGYPLITLLGFVPFTLLSTFAVIQKSLSLPMVLFLLVFAIGLGFSVHHMIYLNKNQYTFTVNFDNVRGFFQWKEILVISAVLVIISILNLGGLAKHHPLTLTGKRIHDAALSPTHSSPQEHEEEIVYSSFKQAETPQNAPGQMPPAGVGGTVGLAGNQDKIGDKYNNLFKQGLPPVPNRYKGAAGGIAGLVGSLTPADEAIPPKTAFTQGTGNALLDTLFMGGSLAAAFGYAFVLAIAGLIFGAMRKFDTAFSRKYVETIHVDTAKVTRIDSPEISPAQQALNVMARMTIGACFGATLGFLLGFLQVTLLTLLFAKQATNPAISPLLSSLGLASSPDLSFANAISLGGLLIPFVMLVVGKMSPQGFSVTDELIRQHYRIEPQGHVVSADQAGAFANPALVSFDGGLSDALEEELETNKLMKELSMDEDNLASEIIDEFGREFESVFGIDTRELLMAQGPRQSVDKKLLASALDESFGELGNVPVEISAELGQATLDLVEWLNLKEGTLVLLNKPANEEIDVLFNGVRKGKGKLIVSDSNLAVKVSSTYFNRNNGNPLHHLSV
jgi:flagellar motor switch/type III secretory pathway protein FliN